jgi:hypothetical protein
VRIAATVHITLAASRSLSDRRSSVSRTSLPTPCNSATQLMQRASPTPGVILVLVHAGPD